MVASIFKVIVVSPGKQKRLFVLKIVSGLHTDVIVTRIEVEKTLQSTSHQSISPTFMSVV